VQRLRTPVVLMAINDDSPSTGDAPGL